MGEKAKDNKEKKGLFRRFFSSKARVVITIIVVLGVIGWKYSAIKKAAAEIEEAIVERGNVKEELILSGEIVADEHALLTFATGGEISYVGVKEGEVVTKGKLLSKLETTNVNSDFERAKADLRAAEATVENIHDQVKDHSGDETFVQKDARTTAEVAKDKAYEAFLKAQRNLRGASLFAPFGGVVTYVANPFVGVNVLATQTQIEILNPETIYFEVNADQTEVTQLSEGQSVNVVLDSFLDSTFSAKIDSISLTPRADEAGIAYKIRVVFDDPSLENISFRIGMTGDAKFILKEKENALRVPSSFVNSDSNGNYVNLGPKNNKVYVETGIEGEDDTEIIGDIKAGDKVFD